MCVCVKGRVHVRVCVHTEFKGGVSLYSVVNDVIRLGSEYSTH